MKALASFETLSSIAQSPEQSERALKGSLSAAWALGDSTKSLRFSKALLEREDLGLRNKQEALRVMALVQLGRNNLNPSYQSFESLIALSEGEWKAEAYYYQALILQKQNQYDSSTQKVNQLIEELPSYQEWKAKALYLMAFNFWKLDDIFQANYILDFLIKSDFEPELTAKSEALKGEIAEAEAAALARKEALLKEQASPIVLDADGQLQLLDLPEEEEPLEELEIIEK